MLGSFLLVFAGQKEPRPNLGGDIWYDPLQRAFTIQCQIVNVAKWLMTIVWHLGWYYVTLETDTLGGSFEVLPQPVMATTTAIGWHIWAEPSLYSLLFTICCGLCICDMLSFVTCNGFNITCYMHRIASYSIFSFLVIMNKGFIFFFIVCNEHV